MTAVQILQTITIVSSAIVVVCSIYVIYCMVRIQIMLRGR